MICRSMLLEMVKIIEPMAEIEIEITQKYVKLALKFFKAFFSLDTIVTHARATPYNSKKKIPSIF